MLSLGEKPGRGEASELLSVHHVWVSPHKGVQPPPSAVRILGKCRKVPVTEQAVRWDVLLFGDAG